MELGSFHSSLQAAKELGSIVAVAAVDIGKINSLGISVQILQAATSGAIVLCVARFEEFIKGAAERSLEMYSKASPPILRSQLDSDLQIKIIRKNVSAAVQGTIHGAARTPIEIRQSIHDVAQRITGDAIWGDHAIETHSNPNAETVAEIFKLLGVTPPWIKIQQAFDPLWAAHRQSEPGHKSVPSACKELDSILRWRNICAHSSQSPMIGPTEVFETIAFFESLSSAIDSVLQQEITARIQGLNSTPAAWV